MKQKNSGRAWMAAAAIVSTTLMGDAMGQLVPERLYYGAGRSIPMQVTVPEAGGDVEIALFAPGATTPTETASAEAGRVDLAGLFPVLWTNQSPKLLYAQLLVGGERIGAPVVLQPLLSPPVASAVQRAGGPPSIEWSERGATYSGLRAYVDQHVILETSLGEIEIRLRPDQAPNTAYNFAELADGGLYTDVIFHRIVPALGDGSPFVIQVGDPTGRGDGGPGYNIDLERSSLPHDFGVVSMARTGDPNSNGSQIFICLSRAGTARLDGLYTAFGETVRGADAIQAIAGVPLADPQAGRPVEPPVIKTARLVPAPPFGTGPGPVKASDAAAPAR